jgi:hypothetical protein
MSETPNNTVDPDMKAEYDFSKGIRGKYAKRYAEGTNVVVLAPDVAAVFPTSEAVNTALRALITLARQTVKAPAEVRHRGEIGRVRASSLHPLPIVGNSIPIVQRNRRCHSSQAPGWPWARARMLAICPNARARSSSGAAPIASADPAP